MWQTRRGGLDTFIDDKVSYEVLEFLNRVIDLECKWAVEGERVQPYGVNLGCCERIVGARIWRQELRSREIESWVGEEVGEGGHCFETDVGKSGSRARNLLCGCHQ